MKHNVFGETNIRHKPNDSNCNNDNNSKSSNDNNNRTKHEKCNRNTLKNENLHMECQFVFILHDALRNSVARASRAMEGWRNCQGL